MGLVTFAFGLEAVVTRCLACGFLALAAKLFGGLWILSPIPMVFLLSVLPRRAAEKS